MDKERTDRAQNETMYLVQNMEYTFVTLHAPVLGAPRTKGTSATALVTGRTGYQFLVAI